MVISLMLDFGSHFDQKTFDDLMDELERQSMTNLMFKNKSLDESYLTNINLRKDVCMIRYLQCLTLKFNSTNSVNLNTLQKPKPVDYCKLFNEYSKQII